MHEESAGSDGGSHEPAVDKARRRASGHVRSIPKIELPTVIVRPSVVESEGHARKLRWWLRQVPKLFGGGAAAGSGRASGTGRPRRGESRCVRAALPEAHPLRHPAFGRPARRRIPEAMTGGWSAALGIAQEAGCLRAGRAAAAAHSRNTGEDSEGKEGFMIDLSRSSSPPVRATSLVAKATRLVAQCPAAPRPPPVNSNGSLRGW